MKLTEFDIDRDVPSLAGKTIVVTGGTAGLGAKTISYLTQKGPAHIYFTGRNQESANQLINTWKTTFPDVPIDFVQCDLQSFQSVSAAASNLLSRCTNLDLLIANAGIMAVPPAVTKEGYESQFGTNHMGHALLIRKLLPALLAASEPRVVSLTSQGYRGAPKTGIPYGQLKPEPETFKDAWCNVLSRWIRYGNGKLANILYAEELTKRYPKISTIALHPGVITDNTLVQNTGAFDRFLIWVTNINTRIGVDDGAKNTVWAATCNRRDLDGWAYCEPVGETMEPLGWEKDKRNKHGPELWDWTERELQAWL